VTYTPRAQQLPDPMYLGVFSRNSVGLKVRGSTISLPTSGVFAAANRASYVPFYLSRPYDLQRLWWQNGATVGTDSLQAAIYCVDSANVMDCCVSTARTLSAGTANHLQYATCSVVAHGITSGTNTTDATTFATASVTLKARPGVMYALSVVNTHGSGANTVTAATTGAALSFTSRDTTQFNSSLSRVTLLTAVPTADVTDTITITIGSAQTATACIWSLIAFTNVDTTTNHGIVQTALGTGSSTTPLATLAAFGSANNASFGAHGTAQSSATPGTNFIEVHDVQVGTPQCGLETEYYSANDTTVDATITSAAWGSIAAEIKSLGTTAKLGPGDYYMGLSCTGTTATVFRLSTAQQVSHLGLYNESSLTAGLPFTATPTNAANSTLPNFGITYRSTP
jgi:hypothetical protein